MDHTVNGVAKYPMWGDESNSVSRGLLLRLSTLSDDTAASPPLGACNIDYAVNGVAE